MRFIKENSYIITKLFINQIGIAILSLVLYTSLGFMEDEALSSSIRIILSLFSTIFYFSLIYTATWEIGADDKIKIDGGKMQPIKFKGAVISLVANIPNFVLSAAAIVVMIIHITAGNEACYSTFALLNLLIRFTSAMFLGILQGTFSFLQSNPDLFFLWQTVGYFVMPIITVGVCHFGYEMGINEKRIFGKLFAKQPKS